MTPWDIVKDLSLTKERLISDKNIEEYNPYLINKAFMYFSDTVFLANEMNINHTLDKIMQYDFYYGMISKRKRFSKWVKRDFGYEEAVSLYFGYSLEKAKDVIPLLNSEQLEEIHKHAESMKQINTS